MTSFRAQFSPVISDTIQSNTGATLKDLKRILRVKWSRDIKTPENGYMASAWSREVSRQLQNHPENQQSINILPLFKEMPLKV